MHETSGLYKAAAQLGIALGAAAALFATPLVYSCGKAAIWRYFMASFGLPYAEWLLWATGAIEAFVIFTVCRGVVTFALTWAMTALVARGLAND